MNELDKIALEVADKGKHYYEDDGVWIFSTDNLLEFARRAEGGRVMKDCTCPECEVQRLRCQLTKTELERDFAIGERDGADALHEAEKIMHAETKKECDELRAENQRLREELATLAQAIRTIFETTHPYREDGSSSIPDATIEIAVKAMKDTGQKWGYEQ